MSSRWITSFATVLLLAGVAAFNLPHLQAQQPPANPMLVPYGEPVSVEVAKKAAAAALAETRKNNWSMAVAVVDPSGNLVYYEKMDNTQLGSAKIAVNKARSAALFKRPTKAFQDALAGGGTGMRVLGLEGAVPVEGGVPLVVDGKIIGAIGLSGDSSEHDAQCARVGADAVEKP
jgi:glc operon protein GlcG